MSKNHCMYTLVVLLLIHNSSSLAAEYDPPDLLIGYNEHRTNLPGGRHANCSTNRANADGSNRTHIQTGYSFDFAPTWSPDGKWLMFVSGEHYNCHPHVVQADGTGLRKLTDRNGYRGVVEFLDVPDYHHGSSDVPVWSIDSQTVFYTAKVNSNVELFQITLAGQPVRLTNSAEGTLHYHPKPSPDGNWIVYGSKRNGIRNLYAMRLADHTEHALTDVAEGHAAMHAYWQPRSAD